jgi:hypothetical protein
LKGEIRDKEVAIVGERFVGVGETAIISQDMVGPRLARMERRMVRRPSTVLAPLILVGGCFYTEEINTRPEAKIEDGADVGYQGDTVRFSSGSRDPDGDNLTHDWRSLVCPVENACSPEGVIETSSAEAFSFTIPGKDRIIVALTVRDPSGAEDAAQHVLTVLNRPPAIERLYVEGQTNGEGGYTLGRTLTIRSEVSDGDQTDTLSYAWELFRPSDSQPGFDGFTVAADETSATLLADVVGAWTVKLTVSDGFVADWKEVPISIDPDTEPCLGPLSPPAAGDDTPIVVERDGGPRTFRVAAVIDDLDPYPFEVGATDPDLGLAELRWLLARPGGVLEVIPGSDAAEYVLQPEAYAVGDELTLRLEVRDRTPTWPTCAEVEPTCATAPGCLQRTSWKVRIR